MAVSLTYGTIPFLIVVKFFCNMHKTIKEIYTALLHSVKRFHYEEQINSQFVFLLYHNHLTNKQLIKTNDDKQETHGKSTQSM